MRRRDLLAATGATAVTAIAGCQSTTADRPIGDDEPDATPTPAATGESRSVIVTGTGEVTGDPDLALLRVGVEVTAGTPGAARDALASGSTDLTAALRAYGLPEDAITTQHYGIHERLDRRRMEADGVRPGAGADLDEYRYYSGSHTFEVEVDRIGDVGAVVDVAVDAGANRVDRVTYTLSDGKRTDLRETAVRRAIRDARAEADAIAAEVDGRIVEASLVDASEGRVHPVSRELGFAEATPTPGGDGGGVRTGLEPGEVTVTARVRVKYTMA